MTKLLKITAKLTASTLIFGLAAGFIWVALSQQDAASIAAAGAAIFMSAFTYEALWG